MKKSNQETALFNSNTNSNKDLKIEKIKTTNVNILLNRVKIDQKIERNKKIIFSISASLGLLVFGIVIF